LKSYSDFGKDLKKQVSEAVKLNLGELNIPTYNKLICALIEKHLNELMNIQGMEKLKTDLNEMLLGENKEYKLSELVEKFKDENEDEAREEDWNEISCHSDIDSTVKKFVHVYLDKEPDKSKYQCGIRLFISDGKLVSATFDDKEKDFKKQNFIGRLYGFERLLFQIYAQGSNIIIDDERVDTYYSSDDC
jgi:hypothetical protein